MNKEPDWARTAHLMKIGIAAALMPTRVGGSGNWAGAVMFLGLSFLL